MLPPYQLLTKRQITSFEAQEFLQNSLLFVDHVETISTRVLPAGLQEKNMYKHLWSDRRDVSWTFLCGQTANIVLQRLSVP
jgi:hypothetical protein